MRSETSIEIFIEKSEGFSQFGMLLAHDLFSFAEIKEEILGEEGDELVESDIVFTGNVVADEHLLDLLRRSLVTIATHGLLPLLYDIKST